MIFHNVLAFGAIFASLATPIHHLAADTTIPSTGVLLIGDSWLVQLAPNAKHAAPAGKQLGKLLQERLSGKMEVRIKNRGAGGTNTFNWRPDGKLLRAAEASAPARTYPWVFVALGINDSSEHYGAFSPGTYQVQLEKIVDELTDNGYRVILQSPPYIMAQGRNHTTEGVQRLSGYRSAIAAIVEQEAAKHPGSVFDADPSGELYQYTLSHPEAIGLDHVHPSALGSEAVATIWADHIVPIIYPSKLPN
ncbi:hypothetical protein CCAX7_40680 [Capsulimonas corticalis]|uniref:Uncharacterized protein n=1 Tax=Capsulimonas corticalis TaxID=2219043 RepID=A0A402D6B3_9BACT|nr:SGNH/GDSL hydrolase family protein [Capsulimonas corticalis]BDI32017.1 hypothetical protein CCAX7_40680 [Capsulimonas corticalis]